MTEYMATLHGPKPEGAEPQSDEFADYVESLMTIIEALDYEPIGGGDGVRGTWSITVTVGSSRAGEWLDAFDEALHLAVTLSVQSGAQVTAIEITSYDDPIFAGIE